MVEAILRILISAVLKGGAAILHTKQSGRVQSRYKDRTELVTTADESSDAAIRAVFERDLSELDSSLTLELEESGATGPQGSRRVGSDPLDGTNHFAAGGQYYSVQAHFVDAGVPQCGVVFQPEAFLPLSETDHCIGRLVYAWRGGGAWCERTEFRSDDFIRVGKRRVQKPELVPLSNYVACVPFSTKMAEEERAQARRVYESGLISVSTGVGGAGANVLMTVLGGQHVYANFGAGNDLDLIPPQVIAEEAGMTVWGTDRRSPVWNVKKQPFVVAPDASIADQFLSAAAL